MSTGLDSPIHSSVDALDDVNLNRELGNQQRAITDAITGLIEEMLRADISIAASVIHECLGSEKRERQLSTRRNVLQQHDLSFETKSAPKNPDETIPGAQAQLAWGDEGDLFGTGRKVYSFHMVLSYSRDPFYCYTHSMDATVFWRSHIRAFSHFGGTPLEMTYLGNRNLSYIDDIQ